MEGSSSGAMWYVVQTRPRQEGRAVHNLCNQGFEVYCPQVSVEKNRRGRLYRVSEPMFSRYLFVRAEDPGRNYSTIRSTIGVSHLVKFGFVIASLSDEVIAFLKKQGDVVIKSQLVKGQQVVMVGGPLNGLAGVFLQEDGEKRSLILVELLSRPLEVFVERQFFVPAK